MFQFLIRSDLTQTKTARWPNGMCWLTVNVYACCYWLFVWMNTDLWPVLSVTDWLSDCDLNTWLETPDSFFLVIVLTENRKAQQVLTPLATSQTIGRRLWPAVQQLCIVDHVLVCLCLVLNWCTIFIITLSASEYFYIHLPVHIDWMIV